MNVDWKNIESKSFTVYPKGAYRVKILSIENAAASTGNDQLKTTAEIITPEEFKGKKYVDFITLVPACDWKLKSFVAGCMDTDALPTMDTESGNFRQLLNRLIGKTAIWIVESTPDRNGNLRNNVVDYQPDPDAPEEDVPDFLKTEGGSS